MLSWQLTLAHWEDWTSCLNFWCLGLPIHEMSSLYSEVIIVRSWISELFNKTPHSNIQLYLLSAYYVPVTV